MGALRFAAAAALVLLAGLAVRAFVPGPQASAALPAAERGPAQALEPAPALEPPPGQAGEAGAPAGEPQEPRERVPPPPLREPDGVEEGGAAFVAPPPALPPDESREPR